MNIKHLLYRWHTYAALLACLPLVIMSFTGSLLVFKPELDRWLQPGIETLPASYQQNLPPRLDLDQLFYKVAEQQPNFELTGWEIFNDHHQADRLYFIRHDTHDWFKAHLDPYSGELLSSPVVLDHYLTDWLLELHYTFLLHDHGLIPGAIAAFILLFLGVSGLILHRNFFRSLIAIRWHKRPQLYLMDLHKSAGAIASPVLLILAITGGYWNIESYLHELEEHGEGMDHPVVTGALFNHDLSLTQMKQDSLIAIEDFIPTYISLPSELGLGLTFWGYVPDKSWVTSQYSSSVSFDGTTGKITVISNSRMASFMSLFIDSFRELHFGSFAGLTSRILWALLGLSPIVLAVSGIWVYGLRKKSPKRKRKRMGLVL